MIKLIRNNFYGRKQLIDINGKKIHWNFLPTLNNVQRKEKLHLGNHVTNRHIRFQKSKMKVNWGFQAGKKCKKMRNGRKKTVMYANKKKISHKNCIVFFYLFTFVWLLHLKCIFSMCSFATIFWIFFPPESLNSCFISGLWINSAFFTYWGIEVSFENTTTIIEHATNIFGSVLDFWFFPWGFL